MSMPDYLFRTLTPREEKRFRLWPHDPANWQPGQPVNETWHPVVRDECARIEAAAAARKETTE